MAKKIVIKLIIIAILVSGVLYMSSSNETPVSNDNNSPTQDADQKDASIDEVDNSEPTTPNEEIEQNNQDPVAGERPAEEAPAKVPESIVAEKPLIYTGYGHNSLKPLPTGQETSTTCTTSSNVECTITFAHATSGAVVIFDSMTTDQEGVARWTWTGGQEVSSGEWQVAATVGDKNSDPETIYVQ